MLLFLFSFSQFEFFSSSLFRLETHTKFAFNAVGTKTTEAIYTVIQRWQFVQYKTVDECCMTFGEFMHVYGTGVLYGSLFDTHTICLCDVCECMRVAYFHTAQAKTHKKSHSSEIEKFPLLCGSDCETHTTTTIILQLEVVRWNVTEPTTTTNTAIKRSHTDLQYPPKPSSWATAHSVNRTRCSSYSFRIAHKRLTPKSDSHQLSSHASRYSYRSCSSVPVAHWVLLSCLCNLSIFGEQSGKATLALSRYISLTACLGVCVSLTGYVNRCASHLSYAWMQANWFGNESEATVKCGWTDTNTHRALQIHERHTDYRAKVWNTTAKTWRRRRQSTNTQIIWLQRVRIV